MKTSATTKPGHQLWGIYHAHREHALDMGDPLRTVVEAPNKLIAEETAARLGFGDAWAQPVSAEQARNAEWLPVQRRNHPLEIVPNPSRGIHL